MKYSTLTLKEINEQFEAGQIKEEDLFDLICFNENFFFEPLIINFRSSRNLHTTWTNPDIEVCYEPEEIDGSDTVVDLNVHRIWVKSPTSKAHLHLVVKSGLMDEFWNLPTINKTVEDTVAYFIAGQVEVMLVEDTWTPGNKQFCFTAFGKKINNFMHRKDLLVSWSPEVCLYREDDLYHWST